MDKHQVSSTSYQARVLRTDVNRSIPTYIPEILDESVLAMSETFKPNEKRERCPSVSPTNANQLSQKPSASLYLTQ